MSVLVQSFDPSATPNGGTFNTNLGATPGTLILFNLSPFELALTMSDGSQYTLPAWLARRFDVVYPCPNVAWTVKKSLAQLNSPVSLVWGEAYSVADAARIAEVYPQELPRVTNVGNAITVATLQDLDQYLVTPGVLTGVVATADPIVTNQLDVTAGVTFLKQASGNVEPAATTAQNFFTSIQNTVYFLDINPDGSFSWGTTHSAVPNALQLWTVSTDGSGHIFIVSQTNSGANVVTLLPNVVDLQVGQPTTILSFPEPIAQIGNQVTAGFLGVPPIVAGAYETHITTTGGITVVSFLPSLVGGLYRISGYVRVNNSVSGNAIKLQVTFFDPQKVGGTADAVFMVAVNQGTGAGLLLNGTNSISNNPYSLEPQVVDHTVNKLLTIVYTDPTNTPSDFVSIVIERLF